MSWPKSYSNPSNAKRAAAPALLLAGLALGAAGCWVPLEKGRQLEARLERLEVEQKEAMRSLEEQREQAKERIARADAKIAEVQKKLDELNELARKSGADLGVQVARLQEESNRLKGELEVQQHALAEQAKAFAALKADTEERLAALRGAGALDELEARKRVEGMSRPDPALAMTLAEKAEAAGEKGIAREIFLVVVKKWPADPRAAEAGYRAGDLLGADQRWREAVLVLGRVVKEHPKSERAPDALLRLADAMMALGRVEDGKSFLEQVVAEHPKSPAAARAKSRLEELDPKPPPKPAPKDAKKDPKKDAPKDAGKKK